MSEKILIIDDEEDIVKFLADVLSDEGYEVLTAFDGIEGLEKFETGKPSLVVTDIKMPRKDGLKVLREIKESGSDVDVIILTGHSDEASAIECLRSGAYDYLLKPLEEIDVLLSAVERALNKRNLEIQNKELLRQLDAMAIQDPLTGLYNFKQLHIFLDEEVKRSERYGHSFCVFMIYVDLFKALKNTYGPLFGDHVLKKSAEIMSQNFRTTDRLFRYGGEAFFVIMPETSQAEAKNAADRVMSAIGNHIFDCDGSRSRVTVSMGGALFPDQAREKMKMITKANQALSQAKKMGRNRVVFNSLGQ